MADIRIDWRRADGSVWPAEAFIEPGARAARSILLDCGLTLTVTEATAVQWDIGHPDLSGVFRFWPVSGLWRRPDGALGGAGVTGLIRALREAVTGTSCDAA